MGTVTKSPVTDKVTKIVLNYDTAANSRLFSEFKAANIAGAYQSLEIEAPHFDFDVIKNEAENKWETQLP